MIYSKPKTKKEEKKYHRINYENEKRDLEAFHKSMNYPKDSLKMFLINSLKEDYEKELKEDGIL